MNTDKLTSILGAVEAVCMAVSSFLPTPFNYIVIGIQAAARAIGGYATNKQGTH